MEVVGLKISVRENSLDGLNSIVEMRIASNWGQINRINLIQETYTEKNGQSPRGLRNLRDNMKIPSIHINWVPEGKKQNHHIKPWGPEKSGTMFFQCWKKELWMWILYLAKLSFRNKREIKAFLNVED